MVNNTILYISNLTGITKTHQTDKALSSLPTALSSLPMSIETSPTVMRRLTKLPATLLTVLVVMVAFTLASCSWSDEYDDEAQDVASNLNFSISTRASANGEEGSSAENQINDYKIYFFKGSDNTYIATFEPKKFYADDEGNTSYTVVGTVEADVVTELNGLTSDGGYKIVVLANWGDNYPSDDDFTAGTTTIDDLCNGEVGNSPASEQGKYTYPEFSTDGSLEAFVSDPSIPFFGVKKYTTTLTNSSITELSGQVDLLRAMAKVEVIGISTLNTTRSLTELDTYIKSARIVYCNKTGYCAPVEEKAATSSDEPNRYTATATEYALHLTGASNTNDDQTGEPSIPMYCEDIGDEDNPGTWVAYVPEYDNSKCEDGEECYIELTLGCEDDYYDENLARYPITIAFSSYDAGSVSEEGGFDVKRNNLYRFTVTDLPTAEALMASDNVGWGWFVKKK
ncbi:MAG: fimbrial protein [Prevotella sp.]|nr:fimbrial protein [Prevotella sp.]